MAQFVYTMIRVGKVVPPKRQILKNISLSFFPGAKIGVLGLNGAGKSTLLKIMAGVETEFRGDAMLAPDATVGLLEQEPHLDEASHLHPPTDATPRQPPFPDGDLFHLILARG